MLLFVFLVSRVLDFFLKIFLGSKMKVCVVCQKVKSLNGNKIGVAFLAAVQQLVDPVDELFVLGINQFIPCY